MELYSAETEVRALKLYCDSSDRLRAALMCLTKEHFCFNPCVELFDRLAFIAKKRKIIPTFTDLLEDSTISEENKEAVISILNRIEIKRTLRSVEGVIHTLSEYAKRRRLMKIASYIADGLERNKDIDVMLNTVNEQLFKLNSNIDNSTPTIYNIGKNSNTDDFVDSILKSDSFMLYKTGLDIFDSRGGIGSEGVLLLAANSGGGKSVFAQNLCKNLYLQNSISVLYYSFEMSEARVGNRLSSCLTGISFSKIRQKVYSDDEYQKIKDAWRQFNDFGKKNDCTFSFSCPPSNDLDIDQALLLAKPYGYKVICIDYVNLLKGTNTERQWQVLNEIADKCKAFSVENKCLVILLAQFDADKMQLKFSKGMIHSADAFVAWVRTEEDKELGILNIKQLKGRDEETFEGVLKEEFSIMRIENLVKKENAKIDKETGEIKFATQQS